MPTGDLDTLWSSTSIRPSTGFTCGQPIQSNPTFATVRLRTKVTKGPGSRAAGIAMAYKLIDAAQARWRAVNAPHLVALVRAGAIFHKALSSVPGTPRRRENGLGLPADAEFSMGPVSRPQSLGAGARPGRVRAPG